LATLSFSDGKVVNVSLAQEFWRTISNGGTPMGLLFTLAIRGLIVLAVFWFFFSLAKSLRRVAASSSARPPKSAPAGTLAKDPVCGTYVDATTSLKTGSNEQLRYFCSENCREEYLRTQPRLR
jgi:YHS domain-containing protein